MNVVKAPEMNKKGKFVQILEDGSEFHCELPLDAHFNDGSGAIFYRNRGFIPFDEFMANKQQAEVKARKEAEAKEVKSGKAAKGE